MSMTAGASNAAKVARPAAFFAEDEQQLQDYLLEIVGLNRAEDAPMRQAIEQLIRYKYYDGQPWFDALERAESKEPLLFCISYPRSGVTRFIDELSQKTGADVFFALRNEKQRLHFDKRWQPRSYPRTRIVKDHRPHKNYLHDDGYLIVRDGRDCMVSLAWMTRAGGRHQFFRQDELKDFIAWTGTNYAFGSWAAHIRRLLDLRRGGTKTVVRYEDQKSGKSASDLMASTNEQTRRAWGFVDEELTGSMFEAWQKSRGKSNWRQSFDRAAAQAFHDTGATELLLELGYETDSNWWKQV
ncbi:MAG: hypothetical protein ABL894_08910 [Hyphomicrobium sp.]